MLILKIYQWTDIVCISELSIGFHTRSSDVHGSPSTWTAWIYTWEDLRVMDDTSTTSAGSSAASLPAAKRAAHTEQLPKRWAD